MTTGVGSRDAVMIVTPGMSNVAPPSAVRCSVEANARGPVEAPTVVTHGPPWSLVAAPGPELPADALTEIPAWKASRNASSTGSAYGLPPPEIEKLMTLTPSRIACWTADTLSDEKQPCTRQTRYAITCAPGAMPHTGPRSTPYSAAVVDAVTGGRGHRVRAVTLGVARRADFGRVVAELLAVGADVGHVRVGERVGADQLLVAREGLPEVGGSVPPPNWQPHGGLPVVGELMPVGDSIGFSGQTPVSMTPTMTFEPALAGAAERRPDGLGADEVGVVVLRLVERVLLDRRHAVDLEDVGDDVRRHLRRDAAVDGRVASG